MTAASALRERKRERSGERQCAGERPGYNERARNYWFRQKHMYMLSDMVMHISPMDQV